MIDFENAVEWSDTDIAVVLHAHGDDGQPIRCLVRGEALDAAYGSTKDPDGRLAVFRRHRRAIEDKIRDKIGSGHLERSPGTRGIPQVVLLSSDLAENGGGPVRRGPASRPRP